MNARAMPDFTRFYPSEEILEFSLYGNGYLKNISLAISEHRPEQWQVSAGSLLELCEKKGESGLAQLCLELLKIDNADRLEEVKNLFGRICRDFAALETAL